MFVIFLFAAACSDTEYVNVTDTMYNVNVYYFVVSKWSLRSKQRTFAAASMLESSIGLSEREYSKPLV